MQPGPQTQYQLFTPTFFRKLQQLRIRTRRSFLGSRQGQHTSHRRGHGLEFADYRLYAPGDDFRHIDWAVLGRTDRLYLRQFRDEQDLNVMFLIDASASMQFQGKFEKAKQLALAIGYAALAGGDTVTFSLLGQRNTQRFRGANSFPKILAELGPSTAQGAFDLRAELRAAVARHRIPGKCFFISDLLAPHEELFAAIDILRHRNFEIALLQILSPSEIALDGNLGGYVAEDSETGDRAELLLGSSSRKEYAALLASHIEGVERYCLKAGITHILLSSEESVSQIVLTKLPELGVLK